MKNTLIFYMMLCILCVGISCTPKTITTKSEEGFSEDLSKYQLNYKDSLETLRGRSSAGNEANVVSNPEKRNLSGNMNAEYAITDSLDKFFNDVATRNREENVFQGLTIQVYSGPKRENANEAKNKVYQALSSAEPRLIWEPPNYKVRVGRYADRLEAQKDYAALRESFPLVLIVPERFKVVD